MASFQLRLLSFCLGFVCCVCVFVNSSNADDGNEASKVYISEATIEVGNTNERRSSDALDNSNINAIPLPDNRHRLSLPTDISANAKKELEKLETYIRRRDSLAESTESLASKSSDSKLSEVLLSQLTDTIKSTDPPALHPSKSPRISRIRVSTFLENSDSDSDCDGEEIKDYDDEYHDDQTSEKQNKQK